MDSQIGELHCHQMALLPRLLTVMGRLLAVMALAAACFLPFAAHADDGDVALNQLFAQLRMAPDPAAARTISDQIWRVWTTPSEPALASRMQQVFEMRATGDMAGTISLLDALVDDYPNYAEGWNQRATLKFMTGDLEASLADCARVLALEPRHFGALAGRAMIYLQLDQRSLALKDISAALNIHPFLTEAQLFPELSRNITRI